MQCGGVHGLFDVPGQCDDPPAGWEDGLADGEGVQQGGVGQIGGVVGADGGAQPGLDLTG